MGITLDGKNMLVSFQGRLFRFFPLKVGKKFEWQKF